nr:hypothetical protein [Tanacetum cinerariifolium]
MLGRQVLRDEKNENIPLCYHVVDNFQIQFGKEELCLVTGLKFDVENRTNYNDEAKAIPFRRRVFSSSLDGRPIREKHVEELINSEAFNKLDDNDVVSLCCVGILQLLLLGIEDRRPVPNWILRLANDRDGCVSLEKSNKNVNGLRILTSYQSNNNMQTQTSNTLHNAIMEAGSKDRPPMLTPGIDNDIYSTVDACPNACEMWKAIERLKQEPSMADDDDDETSKDKEIDKLMALISLSFKKIYKPTNNNLRTSSNTSRANQDNSLRIHKNAGYEHQRFGNVAGARETVDAVDSGPIFDKEPEQK